MSQEFTQQIPSRRYDVNETVKNDTLYQDNINHVVWSGKPFEFNLILAISPSDTRRLVQIIKNQSQSYYPKESKFIDLEFKFQIIKENGSHQEYEKNKGKILFTIFSKEKTVQISLYFENSNIYFYHLSAFVYYQQKSQSYSKQKVFRKNQNDYKWSVKLDQKFIDKYIGQEFIMHLKGKQNPKYFKEKFKLLTSDSIRSYLFTALPILYFLMPIRAALIDYKEQNQFISATSQMFKYYSCQQAALQKNLQSQINLQSFKTSLSSSLYDRDINKFLKQTFHRLNEKFPMLSQLWTGSRRYQIKRNLENNIAKFYSPQKYLSQTQAIIDQPFNSIDLNFSQQQGQNFESIQQSLKSLLQKQQSNLILNKNQYKQNKLLIQITLPDILFLNFQQIASRTSTYCKQQSHIFTYQNYLDLSFLNRSEQPENDEYVLYAIVVKRDARYKGMDYFCHINIGRNVLQPLWIRIDNMAPAVTKSSEESALSYSGVKSKSYKWSHQQKMIKEIEIIQKKKPKMLIYIRKNRFNQIQQIFPQIENIKFSNKIQLSRHQQAAFVAYMILVYIREFDEKSYCQKFMSMRERITDKWLLKQFILNKITQANEGFVFHSVDEIGLQEQIIDYVLCGFLLKEGAQYDDRIYMQQRIKKSNIQEKYVTGFSQKAKDYIQRTVLNPTIITKKIIQSIFSSQNLVISGEKGCGKTFGFMIYNYLSSFILDYRIKLQKNENSALKHYIFVNLFRDKNHNDDFKSVKKMFFFVLDKNLRQQLYIKLTQLFQIQFFQFWSSQIAKDLKRQYSTLNFQSYVHECTQHLAQEKQIQSVCIIDEINTYFSNIRMHQKYQRDHSSQLKLLKLKDLAKRVVVQSNIITNLISSFRYVIFNSSQGVEYTEMQKFQIFQSLFHPKSSGKSLQKSKLNYSTFSNQRAGIIEARLILWFQITIVLASFDYNQVQLARIKILFQNHYKSSQNLIKLRWVGNIRPLGIRSSIRELSNENAFKNIIKDIKQSNIWEFNELQFSQIIDNKKSQKLSYFKDIIEVFSKIETKIQQDHVLCLKQVFKDYVNKQLSQLDRSLSFSLIFHIRSAALEAFSRNRSTEDDEIQQYFDVDLAQFMVLCSGQTAEKENRCKGMIQLLDIGYTTDFSAKQYILRVTYDEYIILKTSDVIFQNRLKQISDFFQKKGAFFTQKMKSRSSIGNFFDYYFGQLLLLGYFSFKTINQENKINEYRVTKPGTSLKIWNHALNLFDTFQILFDQAKQKIGTYISGTPNQVYNEAFDGVIVCYKDKNNLEVITFDVTIKPFKDKVEQEPSLSLQNCILGCLRLSNYIIKSTQLNKKSIKQKLEKINPIAYNIPSLKAKIVQCFKVEIPQNKEQQSQINKEIEKQMEQLENILKKGIFQKQRTISILIFALNQQKNPWRFPKKYEQKASLNQRHLFCIFKHLLWYDQAVNIEWKHVILRPKPLLNKNISFYQKKVPPFKWEQNNKSILLSFEQAFIDFESVKMVELQHSSVPYSAQQNVKYLQTLSYCIMNMLSDKVSQYAPQKQQQMDIQTGIRHQTSQLFDR